MPTRRLPTRMGSEQAQLCRVAQGWCVQSLGAQAARHRVGPSLANFCKIWIRPRSRTFGRIRAEFGRNRAGASAEFAQIWPSFGQSCPERWSESDSGRFMPEVPHATVSALFRARFSLLQFRALIASGRRGLRGQSRRKTAALGPHRANPDGHCPHLPESGWNLPAETGPKAGKVGRLPVNLFVDLALAKVLQPRSPQGPLKVVKKSSPAISAFAPKSLDQVVAACVHVFDSR